MRWIIRFRALQTRIPLPLFTTTSEMSSISTGRAISIQVSSMNPIRATTPPFLPLPAITTGIPPLGQAIRLILSHRSSVSCGIFAMPPAITTALNRPTMTQPYVYWTLEAPFVTIVGLYSNVDGTLDARGTSEQQQWFQSQVSNAAKDKALIVTVHHPPYSLDTTHGGYPDIEIALDRVIQASGRIPTAVLSGHVHSYQRFERDLGTKKVPYIVAGAGGYANKHALVHKIETTAGGTPLPPGFQTTHPDLKLMAHNDKEPGFLRITLDAKKKTLTSDYFLVPFAGTPPPTVPLDTVTVPW